MVSDTWLIAGGSFLLGIVFAEKIRAILPGVFPASLDYNNQRQSYIQMYRQQ